MTRLNLIRWVKACKGSGGVISLIAKRLSVERSTLYDYLKREPAAHKYLDDAREEVLDVAEAKILNAINNDDLDSVKWFLSRKGRHRGYLASEVQFIGKQTNVDIGYKFIIEKPDNARNKMETESEAITGV